MGRPRKGTEETFFDTFSDFDIDDQAAVLKMLTELHRQKARDQRRATIKAVMSDEAVSDEAVVGE